MRPQSFFQLSVFTFSKVSTSKGLTVHNINTKTYDIQRLVDESYEKDLKHRIIFQENLPKWNYLVKPAYNSSSYIFNHYLWHSIYTLKF